MTAAFDGDPDNRARAHSARGEFACKRFDLGTGLGVRNLVTVGHNCNLARTFLHLSQEPLEHRLRWLLAGR